MTRHVQLTALVLVALLGGNPRPALSAPRAPYPVFSEDTTSTVVLLVRHAEKNPHPAGGDSGLSESGHRRAAELARALADAGVSAVYASPFGRAQETALPLARVLGDSVRTYGPHDLEALAHRVLRESQGRTVLLVGHSDTLSETVHAFLGRPLPEGEKMDYDKLFVLVLAADGSSKLLRLRYGAPAG